MESKLFELQEEEDVGIILSDGCRLSSRIWIPKDSEVYPIPAILEYLPYRKRDGTVAREGRPVLGIGLRRVEGLELENVENLENLEKHQF